LPHLKDITTETGMVFSANYTTAPGGGINNEVSGVPSHETNPFKADAQTYSTHDPHHSNNTNNSSNNNTSNFREEEVDDEEDLVGV
jgi:hypothetical protein